MRRLIIIVAAVVLAAAAPAPARAGCTMRHKCVGRIASTASSWASPQAFPSKATIGIYIYLHGRRLAFHPDDSGCAGWASTSRVAVRLSSCSKGTHPFQVKTYWSSRFHRGTIVVKYGVTT